MSTVIPKETISRLVKDVKYMIKNPLTDQGIYYVHDDTDMLKGYAMIVGQEGTPYFGGYFFFKIKYPSNYPHSPPVVKYYTNAYNIRFHPNLYSCGKVCLSLLNTWRGEQWTSCQSISTILLTICTIFTENPILNEPGINATNANVQPYNEIIEYSNINIAICDIVLKSHIIYKPFFDKFYDVVKEQFYRNYDKLVAFAQTKKATEFTIPRNVHTTIYNLNVYVDYSYIISKLQNTKYLLECSLEKNKP